MALGYKLKKIRLDRGLSQANVAEHLNLTRQSISKWENDNGYPDLDNLVRLSEYYEISIDDLIKENQELEVKILDNNVRIADSQQKLDYLKNSQERDEGLALLLISLIGCLIAPLGLIIAPMILKRNKATNTFYRGVVAASAVCFVVSLFVSYGHLSNVFHWGGPTSVEYIGD